MGDAQPADKIVCRELVELVTEYFEGALSPAVRVRFEAHLAACPACAEYLFQMRRTIAVVGQLDAIAASPEERGRLLMLFRRWRDQPTG